MEIEWIPVTDRYPDSSRQVLVTELPKPYTKDNKS